MDASAGLALTQRRWKTQFPPAQQGSRSLARTFRITHAVHLKPPIQSSWSFRIFCAEAPTPPTLVWRYSPYKKPCTLLNAAPWLLIKAPCQLRPWELRFDIRSPGVRAEIVRRLSAVALKQLEHRREVLDHFCGHLVHVELDMGDAFALVGMQRLGDLFGLAE